MSGGGAERVCAILASGFARRGSDVLLVVDSASSDNDAYLDPRLRHAVLGGGHLRDTLRLARIIRREKPDASLSAIGAANLKHTIAAILAGRPHRAVLSVHAFAVSEPQLLSRLAYWATPLLSRLTARTVAVSHSLRADLLRRWKASPTSTVAIHNPVLVGPDLSRAVAADAAPMVLAAGRLTPGKNMRGLVAAFALVARRRPATLVILGEGPERGSIEDDVRALGLEGRVHLPGYVADPWEHYRRAACFVSASAAESFSMVVAEALRYGVPVVAVDCAGPREVLEDGRYGELVPAGNADALAVALERALDGPPDSELRRHRGAAFSVEAGLQAYARLFEEITAERGSPRLNASPLS